REIGRLSNGVVLALLSLHLGADEVLMSGLSLSTHGHAYSDKGYSRGHIDADRLALNEMGRRGLPVRALDPVFAEESGLPLYALELRAGAFLAQKPRAALNSAGPSRAERAKEIQELRPFRRAAWRQTI